MSKFLRLTILAITFSTGHGVNSTSNDDETLKIFALGRVGQLGSLYDTRTQKFTGAAVFLYDSDVTISNSENRTHESINLVSKPSDLFNLLGLDPLTAVGVHTGLIKVTGGHAGFLNQDKYFDDSTVQVIIWKKRVETVTENMNLTHEHPRDAISFDNLKNTQATHVVTGVGWGVGISARIQFPKSMDQSFEDVQQNSSKILLERLSETMLNCSIKIYSDVPIRGMAKLQNCSQLTHLMETSGLPSLLEKTRWKKGKKLTYILTTLDHFRTHFENEGDLIDLEKVPRELKVEADVLENSIKLFDDIVEVNREVNNLQKKMEENSAAVAYDDLKKNLELAQNFANASTHLMTQLAKKIVQVSSGEKENSDLKWFLSEYEDDEFSFVKVNETLMTPTEDLGAVRVKIEFSEFVRSKKTIQYIGRGHRLTEINYNLPTNTSVYLLIFKNLPKIAKSLVCLENRSRLFQPDKNQSMVLTFLDLYLISLYTKSSYDMSNNFCEL